MLPEAIEPTLCPSHRGADLDREILEDAPLPFVHAVMLDVDNAA